MDQQSSSSSKSCQKVNRITAYSGLFGWAFGESRQRPKPGGFCWITINEDYDGDGAGPVSVEIIPGDQRGNEPDGGYRCAQEGDLDGGLLEGFE